MEINEKIIYKLNFNNDNPKISQSLSQANSFNLLAMVLTVAARVVRELSRYPLMHGLSAMKAEGTVLRRVFVSRSRCNGIGVCQKTDKVNNKGKLYVFQLTCIQLLELKHSLAKFSRTFVMQ